MEKQEAPEAAVSASTESPEHQQAEVAVIRDQAPPSAPAILNIFANKDSFEHAQRVTIMLSKSDLVPTQFRQNVGNCIIALEMAQRIGANPLMVMQNLYIVHGKAAWSSTFLIATLNASGRFSPLRYEGDVKAGIRAWAYDKSTKEKLESILVTMDMAKAEGWESKSGSKWKTMPELMMRYRAATFFARQFAPELSMGIHTKEEIEDVNYEDVTDKADAVEAAQEKIRRIKDLQDKVKI